MLLCFAFCGEGSWCLIRVTSAQMSVWWTGSLLTRGREAPNPPQWCRSSLSVRWTARESLLKNRQRQRSSTERRRGLGTSKQKTGYKVTVAARHQSRCGKHQNAECDSRREFPACPRAYRSATKEKDGEKRNWLVITSSFCGCQCCIRSLPCSLYRKTDLLHPTTVAPQQEQEFDILCVYNDMG